MSEQAEKQVKHAETLRIIHSAVIKNDNTLLNTQQKAYLDLMREAFSMLLVPTSTESEVAKQLAETHQIERLRAVQAVGDCKRLFGDVVSTSRQADAHIAYQRAEWIWSKAVKQFKKATTKTQKLDALDVANRALNTAVKIRGLDKDLPEGFDPSKTEPHKYEISVSPEIAEALNAMAQRGLVNLDDYVRTGTVEDATPE